MWQFQLTGLDSVPVGEILNAGSRRLTIALNKLDQCSFSIRFDNRLANQIASAEGFVKVWRKGVLVFYGPIITAEEAGDSAGAKLAVTCQGGGWQIINKSFANMLGPGLRTNTDRAVIVKNEMITAQTWGEYGVDLTALPISSAEAVTYTIDNFMPMADLIRTMQSSDNGFDWRMMPIDNFNSATGLVTGPKHTAFWAAPVLGTERPEAIWEYGVGTRANLASYRTMVSRETQMNTAVSVPNANTFYTSTDSPSNAKWGPLIDVVTRDEYPDKHIPGGSDEMNALRELHVATRAEPRRITTWEPHLDPSHIRMPDYGIDYTVGDTVHGRGIANGQVRFDGLFRCWGVDFDIQDNGFEKANLVLEENDG
jgi:hypothetical protein